MMINDQQEDDEKKKKKRIFSKMLSFGEASSGVLIASARVKLDSDTNVSDLQVFAVEKQHVKNDEANPYIRHPTN